MYHFYIKLHQSCSHSSEKRTCRCASPTLRLRRTCLNNPRVCDGDSWGASACFGTGWISAAQLLRRTAAAQWRPFLGSTQQTNRACLRRDRGTSETAWQIWAWPPWRERKGANWIYIFVFNPPYTPHWLYSSSECRLHVCTYGNRRNTKNICVSNIPVLPLGPVV